MEHEHVIFVSLCVITIAIWRSSLTPIQYGNTAIVNDIPTGLNPIRVAAIYAPNESTPMTEIVSRIQDWDGPISIGGGRFSMGGQIATENSLHFDMRQLTGIKYPGVDGSYDTIIVNAGTTWRQVINAIHPYNRSVMVMQSYADFTVGGSLSVNCHGRYANHGAIVESVLSMYVVFANGMDQVIHPDWEVFNAIIGGYGGIALIVSVELKLVPNVLMHKMIWGRYETDLFTQWLESTLGDYGRPTVLYNVNIVPPNWEKSEGIFWRQGKMPPEWRLVDLNTETDKSVWDIPKPKQHKYQGHVFALQEYFIPRQHANAFLASLTSILKFHRAEIHNLSIRGIHKDEHTILSWAQHTGYSFVLAYSHGNSTIGLEHVQYWTDELIDAALSNGGSFYLPYQLHASCDQFKRAYPRFKEWLAIKAKYDPTNRFRNKLWDKYTACPL